MRHPMILAATVVAAFATSLAAQDPFATTRGTSRPPLTLSFEIDGTNAGVTVDGNEVRVTDETQIGDTPNVRTAPILHRNAFQRTVQLIDHLGAPFAVLSLDPWGVSVRFVERSERPWVGVDLQPVPAVLAEHLDLDVAKVALVASVRPGSPAARGDVAVNDVIVAVDGDGDASVEAVQRAIGARKPGERLALSVLRKGEVTEVEIVVGRATPGVPVLSDIPIVSHFFAQDPARATDPVDGRSVYLDRLARLQRLESQPLWPTPTDGVARFLSDGQAYVVPSAPATTARDDDAPAADTTRLDELEERLARIEALLERLTNARKDN